MATPRLTLCLAGVPTSPAALLRHGAYTLPHLPFGFRGPTPRRSSPTDDEPFLVEQRAGYRRTLLLSCTYFTGDSGQTTRRNHWRTFADGTAGPAHHRELAVCAFAPFKTPPQRPFVQPRLNRHLPPYRDHWFFVPIAGCGRDGLRRCGLLPPHYGFFIVLRGRRVWHAAWHLPRPFPAITPTATDDAAVAF